MFKQSLLKHLAKKEKVPLNFLLKQLNAGRVVIPINNRHKLAYPTAIGEGLKVKINTNIGVSTEKASTKKELEKLKIAVDTGSHTIMDLSVGNELHKVQKEILSASPVPIGTVPIYEVAVRLKRKGKDIEDMKFSDILDVLKRQAEAGVDFFTIHAGILKNTTDMIRRKKRVGGIVSRGGAIITQWMSLNKKENPLYENFDVILDLLKKYNITISLGDALRPGAIADSTDTLQLEELRVLSRLVKTCRKKGVQVMVEGPGHIRLDEIAGNILLQKKICNRAPFYVLGPLPTDIAAGYDHITSAIGGAIAALYGVDFLCVVTPAEHLRHPSGIDIKEGVIASRIAAHSVDLLRFRDEWEKDYSLSMYRAKRQWDKIFPLTIDRQKAEKYRAKTKSTQDTCTMCGQFCSLKIIEKCNLLK